MLAALSHLLITQRESWAFVLQCHSAKHEDSHLALSLSQLIWNEMPKSPATSWRSFKHSLHSLSQSLWMKHFLTSPAVRGCMARAAISAQRSGRGLNLRTVLPALSELRVQNLLPSSPLLMQSQMECWRSTPIESWNFFTHFPLMPCGALGQRQMKSYRRSVCVRSVILQRLRERLSFEHSVNLLVRLCMNSHGAAITEV